MTIAIMIKIRRLRVLNSRNSSRLFLKFWKLKFLVLRISVFYWPRLNKMQLKKHNNISNLDFYLKTPTSESLWIYVFVFLLSTCTKQFFKIITFDFYNFFRFRYFTLFFQNYARWRVCSHP